ncbi:MAG: HAD family hydrolase [Nocardioidaceae bacterium]
MTRPVQPDHPPKNRHWRRPGDANVDSCVDAVVFDLGGVLLDWNPRYLYEQLLPDQSAVDEFLTHVCPLSWNAAQDAGGDWDSAIAERTQRFPQHAALIRAYRDRWLDMVGQVHHDTAALIGEVRARGIQTYVLSNISSYSWQIALGAFDFLGSVDGAVVSGHEGMVKPQAAIYDLLVRRYQLDPGRTYFIDDVPANVQAARRAGWRADVHVDAMTTRHRLVDLGVLPRGGACLD